MDDYYPLDLLDACNAGLDLTNEEDPGRSPPPGFHRIDMPPLAPEDLVGPRVLHGLPFLVGGTTATPDRCYLAFGRDGRTEPLHVPINTPATYVIVAHRLLETRMREGDMPGSRVAEYRFSLEGPGGPIVVPVRERFEISTVPFGDYPPYAAVSDRLPGLYRRDTGPWSEAGRRQTEVWAGRPRSFVLWAWRNPYPGRLIQGLQVVPFGPPFLIAGITVSCLDEHPFATTPLAPLVLAGPKMDHETDADWSLEVDRGVAGYVYPLPADSEGFHEGGWPGWGTPHPEGSERAYANVTALPSATLRIRRGENQITSVGWGTLRATDGLTPASGTQLQVVDTGRNWVRTTVRDAATNQLLPCRIHFRSPEGIPFAPHGHHAHVNTELDTFNLNLGGDLRLGGATYAYIDGTCQGWLPRGEVWIDVACGFEVQPVRKRVQIEPGQQELHIRLDRIRNMNGERWFSGDSHVHFLSTQASHREARGEGLNVVNLLTSQWGHRFSSTAEFTGQPSESADGQSIVYVGQENRQHMLGHLILLGLRHPVAPWCTDGPNEAELGGTLESTMAHWADECHKQQGTVILPHFPVPNGEPPALVASGRADAIELTRDEPYRLLEYYRFLNAGYALPLAGGTDKMSADVPVGLVRTYVHVPDDEPFNYGAWRRNLAAGRTFVTSGPLLTFAVDGKGPGESLRLPAGGGTVHVEAKATGIFPLAKLEIVLNGRVVAESNSLGADGGLELQSELTVTDDAWLAARCLGGGDLDRYPGYDAWGRGLFAHSSPLYAVCGEAYELYDSDATEYMLTSVEGALAYIREVALQYPPGTVTHHHGEDDHRAYLERPFLEARNELLRRRRRAEGH